MPRNQLWWLGIDAADNGAASLVDPTKRLHVVWCWRRRTKNKLPVYDVAICQDSKGRLQRVTTLHDVAELIRGGTERVTARPTWGVAIEGTFVHNNLNTTIKLAQTQGKFEGPLQQHAPGRAVLYMKPGQWRKLLFPPGYRKLVEPIGVPRGKKPKPKHYDKAASFRFIPLRLPPMSLMLQRCAGLLSVPWPKLDDVTDSGGVCEYGWLNEDKVLNG